MTSPAVVVLVFLHVYSIFGTASDPTDHDNGLTVTQTNMTYTHNIIDNIWTNDDLDESNNELKKRNVVKDNDRYNDNTYNDNNDLIYKEDKGLEIHRMYLRKLDEEKRFRYFNEREKRDEKIRVKRDDRDARCEFFNFDSGKIMHPHDKNSSTYHKNINCVTVINATGNQLIQLTFVDIFRIEYHPKCEYDYLEIRDGIKGYSKLLGKVCGQAFPRTIITTGPNVWLKFHSDDTIEYEGFHINVEFKEGPSHSIPSSCYKMVTGSSGHINTAGIDPLCLAGSLDHPLDVLWTIETPANTKIYLNFSDYALAKPNECEENFIEVYGAVLETNVRLAHYCGSMANSVTTKTGPNKDSKDDKGNLMHVRLYASTMAKETSSFNATFTAFRTLDPSTEEGCYDTEFDCDDNTCIDIKLACDKYANCRLKTDEDREHCKVATESTISQPHIMVILIIFSLILSAMSFVFLFQCIKKLHADHKTIKEHLKKSSEDGVSNLEKHGSQQTLDPRKLQRDIEPRASLERENHANEMYKRKRDSYSKRLIMAPSIDSDYNETHLDVEEEPWRREVDHAPEVERDEYIRDIRVERNDRRRRSDMSKREESIRSKRESEERKLIRDASVGAPDTKESGCQTRESLFQAEPAPSSDGSGSNSRGFSTFGYSGATIVRPSPPAQTNTSEITIELLKQVPRQESKMQKKIPDRRPISNETTRSAPDVIIVSKPIR